MAKKIANVSKKIILVSILQTYQEGAHFEALDEGNLMTLMDSMYTQVEINLISVKVCSDMAIMHPP